MSVAYSTTYFGGFGAGPSCGGARSNYHDELPQRRTSTEPLYRIANALPDYDTFRGDLNLVQATRDCFNDNINSLFNDNPGIGGTSTYGSRPELRKLREALQSTAGYFRETVDIISDPEKARGMLNEIVGTLLSRVGALPSLDYPEEACDGRYTEYDPWADSHPVSSKSKLSAPATNPTLATHRSKYTPNDYMAVDQSNANPISNLVAPSLLSHNHPDPYPATKSQSICMSNTTQPDTTFVAAIVATSSGLKVPGQLSWLSSGGQPFASEDEFQTLTRSSDFGTGSGSNSYRPRCYPRFASSKLSPTKRTLDYTVASSASSWDLDRKWESSYGDSCLDESGV
jgi:hypothetical protein